MKGLITVEAREWCSQAAVGLRVSRDGLLRYGQPKEHSFFIQAPEAHRLIAALSYQILTFRNEVSFSGGLLWLKRWDIGSPQLVRPGWLIVESIRRAHGELRSLEAAQAQIFREDELVELHACLIQAIAFGWVSDYVPFAGRFFLHFKDNRQICFMAESPVTMKELHTSFLRWNPTNRDPMVEKMASIERSRTRLSRKPQ